MPASDLLTDPLLAGVPVREGRKLLGGVELERKLGQGGMGAVYKGRHPRLDVDVAVKVMTPPPGLSPEESESFVKRFIREARTAAKIDHANLVRVFDVDLQESGGRGEGGHACRLRHHSRPLSRHEVRCHVLQRENHRGRESGVVGPAGSGGAPTGCAGSCSLEPK